MSSYGISHKGYVRKENEDAYCLEDKPIGGLRNLYVVADGMGGHRGGSIASKMAVDHIFSHMQLEKDLHSVEIKLEDTKKDTKNSIMAEELVRSSILSANKAIYRRAVDDSSFFGMGTTIEVVTYTDNTLYIGHVGDSRVYCLVDNELKQVTKDHSYVQELVDAGVITEDEALKHPNKNRITRALGVDKDVDIDMIKIDLTQDKTLVLLCSDGLTNMIEIPWMNSVILQSISLKERCETLLDEALKNGGSDNITLILVEIERSKM